MGDALGAGARVERAINSLSPPTRSGKSAQHACGVRQFLITLGQPHVTGRQAALHPVFRAFRPLAGLLRQGKIMSLLGNPRDFPSHCRQFGRLHRLVDRIRQSVRGRVFVLAGTPNSPVPTVVVAGIVAN